MRVLHVDSERGWRGGQSQLVHLLREEDSWLCSPREGADVRFGWRDLRTAVRRIQPDLVAAHTARAHQLVLALRGVPVVVHRRVDFRIRWVSRWKYRAVDGVVAVSHAVRDVVVEAGARPDRVFVVEDGVEPVEARGLPERPVVLAVGALVEHKGHEHLIEACRGGGLTLWIAGMGPLQRRLEIQAKGADVHFLGQRDDVLELLQMARVFCHPSVEEGMGQVVLEARAVGCRIVATRAGGIVEALDGVGELVPPGDVGAMTRALLRATRLSRPPGMLPRRFQAEEMVARTLEVYGRVVG